MTKTDSRGIPAKSPIVSRRRPLARILGAVAATCMLIGLATTAVAAPVMSPGVLHPVARLLNYEVSKSARGAYVLAQTKAGYEILPAMKVETLLD
ncbi:MAG: hypothetical protein KC731_35865 [Myxococcales bacterium]|nr:hypothetical protein [Myxococcales bacterium]